MARGGRKQEGEGAGKYRKQRRKIEPSGADRTASDARVAPAEPVPSFDEAEPGEDAAADAPEQGKLVCSVTGEHREATPQEELLQSFAEQLHREYGFAFGDMGRDVPVRCEVQDGEGRVRRKTRTVQLAVFSPDTPHTAEHLVRAVMLSRPEAKADAAVEALDQVLSNVAPAEDRVFGLWSDGVRLAFRMRTYDPGGGEPVCSDLTDFPGAGETLEDLEVADRRPLRVASRDSLVRTFKRCHDYLYGNQAMAPSKAFWQLLYLIFAKILDEQGSRRLFFVGASEGNTEAGRKAVAKRMRLLFDNAKAKFKDVFEPSDELILNEGALTFIAGELGRYSLLTTDADAKGTAYESITSTTLKRERGQFFTPRNVIRMMVELADPAPGQRVLDPACGSGGFLVVALTHVRRRFLADIGCPDLENPMPSELRRVDPKVSKYASSCLWGIDVDPDLRKAARMNMVMNNDGHGNIFCLNSLAYGVEEYRSAESRALEARLGRSAEGEFDFVFTNPPFGSKIPVSDPRVLDRYDLGHAWTPSAHGFVRAPTVHKKVPPEVLFLERCARFLKPGTGVMAMIVPNGILGNPGGQMEFVRWWLLRELELVASVDLPAETFLPQVSVQASAVLFRRRHPDELRRVGPEGPKQGPVFMAIAERCGHGRRGETTWEREPDGSERFLEVSVLERRERDGKVQDTRRTKLTRVLADDMPWVVEQYRRFKRGEPLEDA
ncbi:MAG: N-6 DNA methylase [Deltaproteobacteria bacterium]|nr:N-6 DNA methylase [Deltaproteobacteria bacterium]